MGAAVWIGAVVVLAASWLAGRPKLAPAKVKARK